MAAEQIIKTVRSYLCNQCLFVFVKNPQKDFRDVNSPLRGVGANSHDNNVMIPSSSSNTITSTFGKASKNNFHPSWFSTTFSHA